MSSVTSRARIYILHFVILFDAFFEAYEKNETNLI